MLPSRPLPSCPPPSRLRPGRGVRALLVAAALLPLAGCEIPGMGPDPRVAQREAEAKAIGGACRHALRGLEDCFTLNPKSPKAMVFAGWKDMDQYMRDNKIEGAPSVLTQADKAPTHRARDAADAEAEPRNRS